MTGTQRSDQLHMGCDEASKRKTHISLVLSVLLDLPSFLLYLHLMLFSFLQDHLTGRFPDMRSLSSFPEMPCRMVCPQTMPLHMETPLTAVSSPSACLMNSRISNKTQLMPLLTTSPQKFQLRNFCIFILCALGQGSYCMRLWFPGICTLHNKYLLN